MREYFDIKTESPKAVAIRQNLERNIINQQEAIDGLVDIMEKYHSNIYDDTRPIANLLFVGPTGTGKTKICEQLSETLFDKRNTLHKIDCGEFQTNHEIAKLIGSPPGYLGHSETPPRLKQATIDQFYTKDYPLSVILFDEIEKSAPSVWNLLLSIMDKGKLTLGNNTTTDFTKSIIIMTSNLGSAEMEFALSGGFGFKAPDQEVTSKELKGIGNAAAKRVFAPEFINRLDKIITFNSLTKQDVSAIVDVELERLQIYICEKTTPLLFTVTDKAKEQIIAKGYDPKYNGRNIKRVIEERVKLPLAKIIATRQHVPQTKVLIDINKKNEFVFVKGATA